MNLKIEKNAEIHHLVEKTSPDNAILLVISLGEFIERLGYFAILTSLVIYLTHYYHYSVPAAYGIYGVYAYLTFALPVFGGIVADKILGLVNAMILGLILLLLGNILMITDSLAINDYGLALIILGISCYKPAATGILGACYQHAPNRNSAFTFFYAAINVGAAIGPLLFGIWIQHEYWHAGFICAFFGLCLGASIFAAYFHKVTDTYRTNAASVLTSRFIKTLTIMFFIIVMQGIVYILFHPHFFQVLFCIFLILIIFSFIWFYKKSTTLEKHHLKGIATLCVFCLFFFAASLQVGSSLTIFIDSKVDRQIFSYVIPTQFFSALDPVFIVVWAPLFSMFWAYLRKTKREPAAFMKVIIGLCIASLSFVCFAWSTSLATTYHTLTLLILILGYLLLGAGEICLAPAMLDIISEHSPQRLQAYTMSLMYFSIACAGYLSSLLAQFIQTVSLTDSPYTITFLWTAYLSGGIAIVLFYFRSYIRHFIQV